MSTGAGIIIGGGAGTVIGGGAGALGGILNIPITWGVAGAVGAILASNGVDPHSALPGWCSFMTDWFNDGQGASAGYMAGVNVSIVTHAALGAFAGCLQGAVGGGVLGGLASRR